LSICLHRFCSAKEELDTFFSLSPVWEVKNINQKIWCAIGLNDFERFELLYQNGARNFLVDCASGYLDTVVRFVEMLSDYHGVSIIVGNVHDKVGFNLYKNVFGVRIGIGNGSACETATRATGFGRGQITEISECVSFRENKKILVIADGGISTPANAVKAFGAGADMIMLGGYFSLAEEAQNIINGEYKFWGSASHYNQEKYGGLRNHCEGKVLELNKQNIRPLKDLVNDLATGISSGASYMGVKSWSNMIGNGTFEIKK
jgi:IMP dehydrogenase/GMP reductase